AGGTVAGLAATGSGGPAGTSGTAAGGSRGPSAPARLNATSPAPMPTRRPESARAHPSPASSARAAQVAAAGHRDPFGTATASYLSGRAGTVLAAVYHLRTGRSSH